MDSTLALILATLAFLALHILPSTPLRALAVGAIGERAWLGLFALASLALLAWMASAYARAPSEALWPGLRLVPIVLMPFALVLLACGLMAPNPTIVGQERALAAPEAARGMLRVTRHPIMWGIMLWAGAHLLALGSLKAVVFFGGLLLLAAAGTVLQDARKAQRLGEHWQRFAAATSNLPFAAIAQGRNRLSWREIGAWRPAVGLAAFGALVYFHPWLFGYRAY